MAMKLAIFELDASGHHLAYVRLVNFAAKMAGFAVVLWTFEHVLRSEEYRVHLAGMGVETETWPGTLPNENAFDVATTKLRVLNHFIREYRVDHVHVPYADGLVQVAATQRFYSPHLFQTKPCIDGLTMRGPIAYCRGASRRGLSAWTSFMATCAAPWRNIQIIDPLYHATVGRLPRPIRNKFTLVPDPVHSLTTFERNQARVRFGISPDARVLGCVGGLDERKGIDRLVHAFAAARLESRDILLLAGQTTAPVRHALAQLNAALRSRVILVEGYLATTDIDAALSATDVVCLPYPMHVGSASIAIRAAAHGKPVLGTNFGWLGYMLPLLDMGWTFEPGSNENLTNALPEALARAGEHAPSARTARFVKYSTAENFIAHLIHIWRPDLPVFNDLITWASVLAL